MTSFVENLIGVAAPLAAAGIVSMAFVQTIKSASNLRRAFNTYVFRTWLLHGELGELWMNSIFRSNPSEAGKPDNTGDRISRLLSSKTAAWIKNVGSQEQFFAQDIDVIIDRLKAVGEMSLDYASTPQYQELFRRLSAHLGMSKEDVLPWHFMSTSGRARDEYNTMLQNTGIYPDIEGEANMLRMSQSARSLFQALLTQRLYGIRIRAETWWANINHVIAIVFGALFLAWTQPLDLNPANYSCFSAVTLNVLYCVFGGVMAPFAKELVDNLTGAAAKLKK